MDGETHGGQEEAVGQEGGAATGQQQQEQGTQAKEVGAPDYEKAIAERDEKIASLEAQVAEAAKNTETAEQLRGEIAELKAQGESDRIDFRHQHTSVSRMLDCELGVLNVGHIDSNPTTKDRRERGHALLGVDVRQVRPTNDRTCILTC